MKIRDSLSVLVAQVFLIVHHQRVYSSRVWNLDPQIYRTACGFDQNKIERVKQRISVLELKKQCLEWETCLVGNYEKISGGDCVLNSLLIHLIYLALNVHCTKHEMSNHMIVKYFVPTHRPSRRNNGQRNFAFLLSEE